MNGEYKKLLFVIIFNFTEFHKYEIGISYAILKKVCRYLNLKYLLNNKKDPVEIRIVTGTIIFIWLAYLYLAYFGVCMRLCLCARMHLCVRYGVSCV